MRKEGGDSDGDRGSSERRGRTASWKEGKKDRSEQVNK